MGQDIAAGVTQAMMSSIAAGNPFIQAGKIRRIAITSATRFPGLPELPSLNEIVPGVVMNGWFGVVAPAGASADIIARLNQAIGDGHPAKAAAIRPRHERLRNAQSTGEFIREEQERWRALAKELDIQPQ
jgi:tripartite-type tricarboxylate transporter receptor subunit TctC